VQQQCVCTYGLLEKDTGQKTERLWLFVWGSYKL